MNQILLNGITVNELIDKIGEVIENKIGQRVIPPATQNQSKNLSRKEVACLLKISLPTLNEWTKAGILKSYRVGSRVLYKLQEVEGSLKKREFLKS